MKIGLAIGESGRWFAWFPVRVSTGEFRWLECVTRTKDAFWGRCYYEYEAITKEP